MTQSSSTVPTSSTLPTISVHWLEIVAISLGSIGLLGAAIIGLGHKLQTNMHQAKRVENIAHSLITYQFPHSAQGLIGLSIGAESFAVIADRTNNPNLRLFVQASPVDGVERSSLLVREYALGAGWRGNWEIVQEETQPFLYCHQMVSLETSRGRWSDAGKEEPRPAIEYSIDTTIDGYDQTIRILATGTNAEPLAQDLLKSIQCREKY